MSDERPSCNRPLSFQHHDPPTCGKPAVAKLPIGLSGQLTTIFACAKHKRELSRHLRDAKWVEL